MRYTMTRLKGTFQEIHFVVELRHKETVSALATMIADEQNHFLILINHRHPFLPYEEPLRGQDMLK